MKKLMTMLLVALVVLAACAAPAPEVIEKEVVVEKEVPVTVEVEKEVVVEKEVLVTPTPPAVAPEEYVYVGVSPLAIPYTKLMEDGAMQAGKDINRTVFWFQPTDLDFAKMMLMAESALSLPNLKGMTVICADDQSCTGLYETALERGIAVTAHGGCPDNSPVCYSTDMPGAGRAVAEKLGEMMGGKGVVGIAGGLIGAENQQQRVDSFKEYMAEHYPDIDIREGIKDCDKLTEAAKCAEVMLSMHPDINAYYTVGGVAPGPAAAVFQAAGRTDIIVTAVDDSPDVVEGIRNGSIAFTYLQCPYATGYLMIYVPYLMAEKGLKPTQHFVDTGITFVDKSNVDDIQQAYAEKAVALKKLFEEEIMK